MTRTAKRKPRGVAQAIADLGKVDAPGRDSTPSQPPQEARTAVVTVGLVKGRGIGSWLIRWLAKGGWSHCVAIVLPGGMHVIDARVDVIDGIPAGVQIRPVSYLKGLKCLWLEIPCTPSEAKAIEEAARSALGDRYDIAGIIDFATGAPDNSWKRTRGQDFFCSALGIWSLWRGGLLSRDVLVPFTSITPGGALGIYWGLGAREAPTPAGLLDIEPSPDSSIASQKVTS